MDRRYNELSFDDTPDHEEVFVHASRNLREEVGYQRSVRVTSNDSLSVGGARSVSVDGDLRTHTGGTRAEAVSLGDTLTVGGSRVVMVHGPLRETALGPATLSFVSGLAVSLGAGVSVSVGQPAGTEGAPTDPVGAAVVVQGFLEASAADTVTLSAKNALYLQCGESRIALTPEGVRIEGRALDAAAQGELNLYADDLFANTKGDIELCGDQVRAFGSGSNLKLDREATLEGARAHVRRGMGKSPRELTQRDDQAVFRFARAGSREGIPGIRVGVRHPDGSVRTYVTDGDGEVCIPGRPGEVFEVVSTEVPEIVDGAGVKAHRL